MGLIRKSLAVATIGTVKGSSKKQRVAKQTLTELRKLNATAPVPYVSPERIAAARVERLAREQAARGHDPRMFWER